MVEAVGPVARLEGAPPPREVVSDMDLRKVFEALALEVGVPFEPFEKATSDPWQRFREGGPLPVSDWKASWTVKDRMDLAHGLWLTRRVRDSEVVWDALRARWPR